MVEAAGQNIGAQPENAALRQSSEKSSEQCSEQSSEQFSPLLLGTYNPKIDSKGRITLPSKFRSHLTGGLVFARGQERCVYILPQNEFRRIAAQIQHTSLSNKAARSYLRVFLSGAVDDVPDKQGRVIVPQILRKYAGIEKDVTVIGVGTRAEIWDTAAWEEYLASQEEDYSNMADDVLPEVDF